MFQVAVTKEDFTLVLYVKCNKNKTLSRGAYFLRLIFSANLRASRVKWKFSLILDKGEYFTFPSEIFEWIEDFPLKGKHAIICKALIIHFNSDQNSFPDLLNFKLTRFPAPSHIVSDPLCTLASLVMESNPAQSKIQKNAGMQLVQPFASPCWNHLVAGKSQTVKNQEECDALLIMEIPVPSSLLLLLNEKI